VSRTACTCTVLTPECRPAASVWGEKLPFNTVCGEYGSPSGGWVHAVGFSPSGDVLAFASPSRPPSAPRLRLTRPQATTAP
jgi:hypothetical protein